MSSLRLPRRSRHEPELSPARLRLSPQPAPPRRASTPRSHWRLHRSATPNPVRRKRNSSATCAKSEREVELQGVNVLSNELSDRLSIAETAWAKKLAERLQTRSVEGNPACFSSIRVVYPHALELPGFRGPIPVADAVKAAEFAGETARLVVEIPPLGFAWVSRANRHSTPLPKSRMKLADGPRFATSSSSATSIRRPAASVPSATCERLTRFGHQLVFNPGSRMIARDIAVTNAGTARSGRSPARATSSTITTACSPLSAPRFLARPAVLEIRIELRSATRTDRLSLALLRARFGCMRRPGRAVSRR